MLYQSGYLTLKDYYPFDNEWTLGFPNEEVYRGFARSFYNYYMEQYVGSQDTVGNAFNRLRRKQISMEQFIEVIRKWYAGIPYSITDKIQGEQQDYAVRFPSDSRPVYAVGLNISADRRTIDNYELVKVK